MERRKITVPALQRKKAAGERITMLTCYDATFARLLDATDVDLLLVGDSLGMVISGHETTLPVTVDEMVYHCRAVVRGTRYAHVVGDLPFMSYQLGPEQALESAGRLVKEGGVGSVKLEGGSFVAEAVRRCTRSGIPVMGHLGLTPQSIHQMGGYKVQGRKEEQADFILGEAKALEQAGVYSLVLEGIPEPLGERITSELSVPTIGIGAGRYTDGQVLVIYDLLGLDPEFKPKFVRWYGEMGAQVRDAVGRYCSDVRDGSFPSREEVFCPKQGVSLAKHPA